MFGLNASKEERSDMNGSEGIGMENQIKTRQRGCDLKRSSDRSIEKLHFDKKSLRTTSSAATWSEWRDSNARLPHPKLIGKTFYARL